MLDIKHILQCSYTVITIKPLHKCLEVITYNARTSWNEINDQRLIGKVVTTATCKILKVNITQLLIALNVAAHPE